MKRFLQTLIILILSQVSFAQYYNTGQEPASYKWLKIKTGKFTVIYPETYGSGGIMFAGELEKAWSEISSSFAEKKTNIPVIIHNHTTQTNGYVAWAPRRMEIYPTPGQNSIPLGHNRQLALHELTHVMQLQSLNTGFTGFMSYIFGEQLTGAIAAFLPLWYLEGEAVFNESLFTESGRGRNPGFINLLKAISIENGEMYKYDKLFNGSYKNYTPDYYQYGYQLYTWALMKNDPEIWKKALKFTGNQPFTLNPVNISLTRSAGLTKKKLFYQTFDSLGSIWKDELKNEIKKEYDPVTPPVKREYESYYSPVSAGNDSLVAVKTSLSEPVSFVLIRPSDNSIKKLFTPGNMYPWIISFAKGKLVWVEPVSDPRWANRSYSVIKSFDIKKRVVKQLSFQSRYMAASVSPDGRMIAAIENREDNTNSLVLLIADNGSVIKSIPAPGNLFIQRPQWSDNGKTITFVSLGEKGEGIISWSHETGQWETLVEEDRFDIQSTFLRNDSLLYVSSVSGTDNIYLLEGNGRLSSVTFSKFGASDLHVTGNNVFFSNLKSDGNTICKTSLADAELIENTDSLPAEYLIDNFVKNDTDKKTGEVYSYTPEPFRKWKHLFNIHSWMPLYADIEAILNDPVSIRPGLMLMSQNLLSTLTTSLGYEYSADHRHKIHSRLTWEGWYPVIESRLDYGNETVIDPAGAIPGWSPSSLNTGLRFINNIYIPWSFTTGKYSQLLYPYLSADYRNDYIYESELNRYNYGQILLSGRIYFANYHRSSYRDIYPGFGQVVDVYYSSAPFDKKIYGSDSYAKIALYFPGFIKNHGIRLRYESEKQSFVRYLTRNRINYPRAYKNIISEELDFFSLDYVAPLVYPDINIGSLIYITRLRTGLFYDYALGNNNYHLFEANGTSIVDSFYEGKETFSSYGIELITDFYLLRIPYEISAGVQAAWKDLNEAPLFELIFNIDIYGMNIGRLRR